MVCQDAKLAMNDLISAQEITALFDLLSVLCIRRTIDHFCLIYGSIPFFNSYQTLLQ